MNILITGGGGFIGSGLLIGLSDKHKIICLDHGRRYPILQTLLRDNVRLIEGDITDINLLDRIMQKSIDVVIHLAGGGGNNACMEAPSNAVMTNVYGTHLLLQKSLKYHIKHFIFASSQSVYSTFKVRRMPLTEDMKLEPDDLYGALKAAAEYEIHDSHLNHTILRIANVYGYVEGLKGIQKGGALENFIKSSYEGSDITVFGTGKQKIDYVHINDVSRCIKMILENSSIKNEIFNVGSGELHSIEEIARIVSDYCEKLYKHQVNIKKKPAPKGKIWPDRLMSIEKIKHRLKWKPSVSLKDGIREMMTNVWGN
jgi:UDP-glucose 4-epimerase